jgi:hypothetical protein
MGRFFRGHDGNAGAGGASRDGGGIFAAAFSAESIAWEVIVALSARAVLFARSIMIAFSGANVQIRAWQKHQKQQNEHPTRRS